jgi:WD40 repeat protein
MLIAVLNRLLEQVPSDPQSTRIAQGHRGSVKAMAFTPSGSLLATAGLDKTVRFWDVKGLGNEGSRRRDEVSLGLFAILAAGD